MLDRRSHWLTASHLQGWRKPRRERGHDVVGGLGSRVQQQARRQSSTRPARQRLDLPMWDVTTGCLEPQSSQLWRRPFRGRSAARLWRTDDPARRRDGPPSPRGIRDSCSARAAVCQTWATLIHRERDRAALSRVSPTPVDIWVDGAWIRGTVRTCEVTEDGQTCSAVVSYGGSSSLTTARVAAGRMRKISGDPGCPVDHQDATCS